MPTFNLKEIYIRCEASEFNDAEWNGKSVQNLKEDPIIQQVYEECQVEYPVHIRPIITDYELDENSVGSHSDNSSSSSESEARRTVDGGFFFEQQKDGRRNVGAQGKIRK